MHYCTMARHSNEPLRSPVTSPRERACLLRDTPLNVGTLRTLAGFEVARLTAVQRFARRIGVRVGQRHVVEVPTEVEFELSVVGVTEPEWDRSLCRRSERAQLPKFRGVLTADTRARG